MNQGKRGVYKPGDKFGNLTIRRVWTEKRYEYKNKETICECECDCGNITTAWAQHLVSGHKRSCGCLQNRANNKHHGWKGHKEISGTFWTAIQRGCKRRGRVIPFDLLIEDAWNLFVKQDRKCALSGVAIGFAVKDCRRKECTASLDRINSSGGYTIDNVQWVHKTVQNMKWALPQDDFIEWCKLIATTAGTSRTTF